MATTIQLVASAYTTSTQGVLVSNPSNAYTNASSTTYATVDAQLSNSAWADFYGFDFSQIPSDARITSMTFKIKTNGASSRSSWSVYLQDTSGNITISDTATHTARSTYTDTLTPTKTFSQIIALGNNFHFRIATSSSADVDVYGMEVNVTYVTPVPNKVDYIKDGVLKTLIDLTGDDILPEDVTAGKLFHLATGEQAVGTGGGLEYETGTFSPSSATDMPTVSFTKSHTKPPSIVAVFALTTGSGYTGVRKWIAVDFSTLISDYVVPSSGTYYAGFYSYVNGTTTGEAATVINKIRYGGANTTSSSTDYWRYFATSSNFKPKVGSQSSWKTTVSNSWIAIWT